MGTRPDKFQSGISAGLSKLRIFRKKTVTGVDGFGARALRCIDDLVNPKIGFGSCSGADKVSLVRFADVEGGAVDVGINGNGSDAHFVASTNDAHRDFSPVGDQNLLEHLDARCRPDFTCGNGSVHVASAPKCKK